jgi:hypothetical protein
MALVDFRLFDPEEDEDHGSMMRRRHLAISVHTARWDEFREVLHHALATLEVSALESFHRRHVDTVVAQENARTEQVSSEHLCAVLSSAQQLVDLYLGLVGGVLPPDERAVLAEVRTAHVPRFEQLAAGKAVVSVPRQGWLRLEQNVAHAQTMKRLFAQYPPFALQDLATSLGRCFEGALKNDVHFTEPGYRSPGFDEPEPDEVGRVLEAASRCAELCCGELPRNFGIGGALELVHETPPANRFFANRAVASKQSGVHVDLVDVDLVWDMLGFASGEELGQFIEVLDRPFDLKAEWRRQEEAEARGRTGNDWESPADERAWADRRADDCGHPSFDDAQRAFSSRVARFQDGCREAHAAGRTLLTWDDKASL